MKFIHVKYYIYFFSLLLSSSAFSTETKSGDWEVSCKETCVIGQAVTSTNGSLKFGLTITQVKGAAVPIAQINTPLGLYLPRGLGIQVSDKKMDIPFITCLPTGCKAIFKVTDALVAKLNKSNLLQMRFYTQSKTPQIINISLNGFEDAIKQL